MKTIHRSLSVPLLACLLMLVHASAAEKPVRVFILAGQSNMEGKAPNELLDHQATDAKTKEFFAHLRHDDKWAIRDDVLIKFLDRKGPLTVGYGSPGCTGAELEFGTMMGNRFDEPVVLIKTAWGGVPHGRAGGQGRRGTLPALEGEPGGVETRGR